VYLLKLFTTAVCAILLDTSAEFTKSVSVHADGMCCNRFRKSEIRSC